MRPNQEGMECWVDAAHASEWNNKTASNDPNTKISRASNTLWITDIETAFCWLTTKTSNENKSSFTVPSGFQYSAKERFKEFDYLELVRTD